ncbi:enoyl-CoA hydratase/isomerase family protein [Microbacterium sp. BWT-B31]|uniref:enoyl-CoA hydratase/isomerase family protein n=1 Tax=Microbacterium sp. BWT-B31 TaxID=3232072 RepID=UPI003526C61D
MDTLGEDDPGQVRIDICMITRTPTLHKKRRDRRPDTKGSGTVTSSLVTYEQRDGIGYITFRRPEVLNAFNDDALKQLREALEQFDQDDDAQVGILNGSGDHFSSGADIKQRQLRPTGEMAKMASPQARGAYWEDLLQRFAFWKPMIAAVHGYTIGGAFHLALMCEMIVADETTTFRVPELPRGLWVANFFNHLAFRSGAGWATDVCLTGRFFTAEEAYERGVANRLTPKGEHLAVAEELARLMMENPPLATREFVQIRRLKMEELEYWSRLARRRDLHLTEDFQESARAFAEKRKPNFNAR